VDGRGTEKALGTTLKDNDVAVVLHHRQPSDAVKAVISEVGKSVGGVERRRG
jgi:hypothetical protein